MLRQLARDRYQGQIVGAHGTGKSTLLATLVAHLKRAGARLHEVHGSQRLRRQLLGALWDCRGQRGIAVVDGFERLNPVERGLWVLGARALRSGLLVTCHRRCLLPVIWRTDVDVQLAERVVAQLTRHDTCSFRLAKHQLATRLARHAGDMRETLFELYDVHHEAFGPASSVGDLTRSATPRSAAAVREGSVPSHRSAAGIAGVT